MSLFPQDEDQEVHKLYDEVRKEIKDSIKTYALKRVLSGDLVTTACFNVLQIDSRIFLRDILVEIAKDLESTF